MSMGTNEYVAVLLENARKATEEELTRHHYWCGCEQCVPPKKHWYGWLTRKILAYLILILMGTKWSIQRKPSDPYNPWHWRLKRKCYVGPFVSYWFPIIRSVYPNMLDIAAIQPMPGRYSAIEFKKDLYGEILEV